MSEIIKPPTQSVGVAGFKADLYASDIKKIDWHILIHLPKFQMYAVEVAGRQYGQCGNVMEWIMVTCKTRFMLAMSSSYLMLIPSGMMKKGIGITKQFTAY